MRAPASPVDDDDSFDVMEPCSIRYKASSDEEETETEDEDDQIVTVQKKFETIKNDLKDDKLVLHGKDGKARLYQFLEANDSSLGQHDPDGNTLLHFLVDDARDKVIEKYELLVEHLITNHPDVLRKKNNNEKTVLYNAIDKKRGKLVRFICDRRRDIDEILGISCYHSENCLHVAMHCGISTRLALYLIEKAGENTLCAKDDWGNTPLHLAVAYERCTDEQLKIVQALVEKCDKALDIRTNEPNFFSPYRYHEHTRAEALKRHAKEKATEGKSGGKKDERNTPVEEGSGGKEAGGSKSKMPTVIAGPTSAHGSAPEKKHNEYDPLLGGINRVNSVLETAGKSSKRSTGTVPQKMVSTMGDGRGSDGKGFASKASAAPKDIKESKESKESKKKKKQRAEITKESAAAILDYLKIYCMRTRGHDEVVEFLYPRGRQNQIFFDLFGTKSLEVSEEQVTEFLGHAKFEDTLQYVALPRLQLERRVVPSKLRKSNKSNKPDGNGRKDMTFFFDFLRDKGVKRVLHIIVDDEESPAHSDEAIEKALSGLKVEIWDWRKIDLCSETVLVAAPDTTEVYLYWSGNNAVLLGWSSPDGLPQLKKLKKVHVHVKQGLETEKRTKNNIRRFETRLKEIRPDIEVNVSYDQQPKEHAPTAVSVDVYQKDYENRHKWLTCMDEFAEFIQNIPLSAADYEPVTIALIDDGVDIIEPSIRDKIVDGASYCVREENQVEGNQKKQTMRKPYYVSGGGHGTVMASLICRVCPKAQLFVVKLDEYLSETSKRQITAKSAAKAIEAAVDRKVHIISMSWTIKRTHDNEADIKDLESAIERASKAGILMFCAANDQGIARDRSYPAACTRTKNIFKIGAAEASGAAWKWLGDAEDVDFIFPGHNVVMERPNNINLGQCQILTGSSVATAIATGLAALVLYCTTLSALHNQTLNSQGQRGNSVTMDDLKALRSHERMNEAFLAIGTKNKYIEVWNVFEPAVKRSKSERVTKDQWIEIVTDVAERLKLRKTLE